jgi:transposase
MSSLVYLKNKQNNVTYVYENTSVWNKEKKRADCHRKCIGKLDPVTGALIPSRSLKPLEESFAEVQTLGATLLCETVAKSIGIDKVLAAVFPTDWDKILTCAYYLLCEEKALCHVEQWSALHRTPCGSVLTSQRVTDLLYNITPNLQMDFFKSWLRLRRKTSCFALDITSVSSYSELNEYVRMGYNRDKEKLPQINLCVLLDEVTRIPIYFELLPGSIRDVSALANVITLLDWLSVGAFRFVMDRGFYSATNIDELFRAHYRFTIGVPFTLDWAKQLAALWNRDMETLEHYHKESEQSLYMSSSLVKWKGHRCYRHLYYDERKASEERADFMDKLALCKEELALGKALKGPLEKYGRYFQVRRLPKRGIKVDVREDLAREHQQKTAGFFILMSNDIKDPKEALRAYRAKDAVEKGFDDMKNTLDMNRLRVHSAGVTKGRLFVQFIALAISSGMRNNMDEAGLSKRLSLQEVLSEMKTLNVVKVKSKHRSLLTRCTKLQREILDAFKIDLKAYV